MADFCQACSKELFDEDFRELAGISTPEQTAQGLFAQVICEGCGVILVDHDGRCRSPDCMYKGKQGHGDNHPDLKKEST